MDDTDDDGEKGQKLRVLVDLPHFLQVSGKVGPTAGGAQVSVEHKDYYNNRSLSRLAHAKNKIKYEVLILYIFYPLERKRQNYSRMQEGMREWMGPLVITAVIDEYFDNVM